MEKAQQETIRVGNHELIFNAIQHKQLEIQQFFLDLDKH